MLVPANEHFNEHEEIYRCVCVLVLETYQYRHMIVDNIVTMIVYVFICENVCMHMRMGVCVDV